MKRALDLFCKAGGATRGLQRAGYHVTGVDIEPQPNYCGDEFIQADALTVPLVGYDYIWASPPCQRYSRFAGLVKSQGGGQHYSDLIEAVRQRLEKSGIPYTIENVIGAPLRNPLLLCGSSFGLLVRRHRLFESNFLALAPQCSHHLEVADKPPLHRLTGSSRVVGCYGNGRGKGDTVDLWKTAMGIDWMTRKELSQAIPPVYSEHIAKQVPR